MSSEPKLDFSATGHGRVIVVSVTVTLVCVFISLLLTDLGIVPVDPSRIDQQRIVNVVAPVVIAFPVMYFLMGKLRELAIAHRRLEIYAATDALTGIMNRAAFSTLVEAYLEDARQRRHGGGALLIVDVDHFKAINDRFGHDRGDEALIAMARAMRASVRSPDIVGRLGGEEFGVFLPGAGRPQAEAAGERLRRAVSALPFAPEGTQHRLSISVGGVVFDSAVPFAELFRRADEQLYAAKGAGRDRVTVAAIPPTALAA